MSIFVLKHVPFVIISRGRCQDRVAEMFSANSNREIINGATSPIALVAELTHVEYYSRVKGYELKSFTVYAHIGVVCVMYTRVAYNHWRVIYMLRHAELCVLGWNFFIIFFLSSLFSRQMNQFVNELPTPSYLQRQRFILNSKLPKNICIKKCNIIYSEPIRFLHFNEHWRLKI